MDEGDWKAAVHGVAESRTRLSDFTFTFHFHALEKEMATHSSVLAWRIPETGQPAGLPSMGLHRVGHDWSDSAAAAAAAGWPWSGIASRRPWSLGRARGKSLTKMGAAKEKDYVRSTEHRMQAESAGVGGDRQGAREQLDAWGAASRNSFRTSLLIKIFWLCVKFSRISTECRLHLPKASPPEHAFWNLPSRSSIEAAAWSDTHTLCKALLLDLHMIKKKEKQWKKKPRLVFPGAVVLVLYCQSCVPGPASLLVLSECLGDGTETVWARRQCRLCLLQPMRQRPLPESPPGLVSPQEAVWIAESHLLWETTQAPVLLCQESAAWPWASHLSSLSLIFSSVKSEVWTRWPCRMLPTLKDESRRILSSLDYNKYCFCFCFPLLST